MLDGGAAEGFCPPSPRVRIPEPTTTGTNFGDTMSESEPDNNSPLKRPGVKFLCSFGGNIFPRPYDGKLRYVGGETRIVRVNRDISFPELVVKMSEFYDPPFTLKYQLPEEDDLDALVSVLSDDDLTNMMEEYDKLETSSCNRLRVFLFSTPPEHFDVNNSSVVCCDKRFVDALNGNNGEGFRRSESCNNLNCVGAEVMGSIPRRVFAASPPVSPNQLQPTSPFSMQVEDFPSDQQQQQLWALGSHLRMQDLMSSASASARSGHFQDVPSGFGHKFKHSPKVFPTNESYFSKSPEFGSPRDLNRVEASANYWPEDVKSPVGAAEILPHQVNVHHHIGYQQQNMHEIASPRRKIALQPVNYRMFDAIEQRESQPQPQQSFEGEKSWHPLASNYASPHHTESNYHASPHHTEACYSNSNPENDYEFTSPKIAPVIAVSQGTGAGEGFGRHMIPHALSTSELDRYAESQNVIQGFWVHERGIESRLDYGSNAQPSGHFEPLNLLSNHNSHLSGNRHVEQCCQPIVPGENNPVLPLQNMSQMHGKFQRSDSAYEYPYERQHPSYFQDQQGPSRLDLHVSNRVELQVHNPHYVLKEGLPIQNASPKVDHLRPCVEQVHSGTGQRDRLDRTRAWVQHPTNCHREATHVPLVTETSGVLTTEEVIWKDSGQNSYLEHDFVSLKPDVSYNEPTPTDLYKHPPSDIYKPSSHVRYNPHNVMIDNCSERESAYQMSSTNGKNHRCYCAGEEKNQEVVCVQMNAENREMQQCSTAPYHRSSTNGKNVWCNGPGEERNQEVACVQMNAENLEMQQCSSAPYERHVVDIYNFPGAFMSHDLLHKDIADISRYEGNMPKEFHHDPDSEINHMIEGVKSVIVSSHCQTPKLPSEHVSNACGNSEGNAIISNSACPHIITSSKVFLPDSLNLSSTPEVLSSTLSSGGPPIYDRSPAQSIQIMGQKDSVSEKEGERQLNELENPVLRDFRGGQLTDKLVSNIEGTREEYFEETTENCLNDTVKVDAPRVSIKMTSLGQNPSVSDSDITSTTKVEVRQDFIAIAKEGDRKEVEQEPLAFGSQANDCLPEGEAPEDNPSSLEENISNNFVNIAKNNASISEANAVAQGLQTIRNDDLEEVRELGSGTYGTVYYGKWKGSDVAIKRIKASYFTERQSEQDRLIADFWKEACILSQLHHPNVVAFYGVVRDGPDGTLATVTEFMVNGSLKQVLHRKDRTIDRRKRIIIARDAAFGMEYLHEKNIVHFDLKCDNLLVNMKDPHRPICKIGDLGLSKIKQRTLVSSGVRGTLPWMAPELLCGQSGMVTEKVDVYSFGIVMWEILTGEEPYGDMSYPVLIGGIMSKQLRPTIPDWCREPAWRSLMERCWSHDPGQRPSFSEIATELRAMGEAMNIK